MLRTLFRLLLAFCIVAAVLWFVAGGHLLVTDHPQHSDAILVLEGENHARVARGLELLRAGYAPRIIFDVKQELLFGQTKPQIAQQFIATLPEWEREHASVCALPVDSTREEARAAVPCLRDARNVLLVTSDYHSRRALSVFRHEIPQDRFSVGAAVSPPDYGANWWQHRAWAKRFAGETAKFAWFEGVERWR